MAHESTPTVPRQMYWGQMQKPSRPPDSVGYHARMQKHLLELAAAVRERRKDDADRLAIDAEKYLTVEK